MSATTTAPTKSPSLTDPLPLTLLGLTFTTGVVDAVSYLGLGHVFTANMTGNIVLLGFGLAGAGHLPVLAPIVSLVAFLVGAAAAGRAGARMKNPHGARLTLALISETVLVAAAAVLNACVHSRSGTTAGYATIALVALAMGIRNATVRKIAQPDLTTTVLTLTITGLAAESPLAGGTGGGSGRRLAAAGVMLGGALAGALLTKVSLAAALGVAAALVAAGSAVSALRTSEHRPLVGPPA
jgi:uncharacterized membrane protein YoaK (UPF0700 family)